MASLIAKTPFDGLLPVTAGRSTLAEVLPGQITSLSPYPGQQAALSGALQAAHGLAFPAPNRVTEAGAGRAVWTGRDQAFLLGVPADAALTRHAALTDQSDGWAAMALSGADHVAVLARLVPLDLRPAAFAVGHAARSQLQHVMAILLRTGPETVEIMVMRSFAATAVHEITVAMQAVAAR